MKNGIVALMIFLSSSVTAFGQIGDNAVEGLMTMRILDCEEISYNSVNLIPRLYKENKTDTLNAVVDFWRRNCGMKEPLVSYSILTAIKDHSFKEELKFDKTAFAVDSTNVPSTDYYATNIIAYLNWYYYGFSVRHKPKIYIEPHHGDYYVANYAQYYDFLNSIALSLNSRKDLSKIERFLVDYFIQPNPSKLDVLLSDEYNGTVLQAAYKMHKDDKKHVSGFQLSAHSGMWVPQDNASRLGNHPYLGGSIGGRNNKVMIDFSLHIRFIDAPAYYNVTNNDTVYQTKSYTGFYLGLDGGYQLLKFKRHEFDLLGGFGLDGFEAIFNNDAVNTTYPSLNLNAGLGYKIFLKHKDWHSSDKYSYIAFQAKYNWMNYCNKGGTDMTGNAYTFGIIYGLYYRTNDFAYNPM